MQLKWESFKTDRTVGYSLLGLPEGIRADMLSIQTGFQMGNNKRIYWSCTYEIRGHLTTSGLVGNFVMANDAIVDDLVLRGIITEEDKVQAPEDALSFEQPKIEHCEPRPPASNCHKNPGASAESQGILRDIGGWIFQWPLAKEIILAGAVVAIVCLFINC